MSKRGENITKRKDGRWEARYIKEYNVDGKAVYGYLYAKTYTEAKAKKTAAITEQKTTVSQKASSGILFNELVDLFLTQQRYQVKESTFAHYKGIIDSQIRPQFGNCNIKDISSTLIETYTKELLTNGRLDGKGGLSPKSVKDIISIIRLILKYGIEKNMLNSTTLNFASPRISKPNIEILTTEEQKCLERFSEYANDDMCFGVYLCLYTGLRIGELCALQWKDIDVPNSCIKVNKTLLRISDTTESYKKTKILIDTPKTQTSIRIIPLPLSIVTHIKKRQAHIDSMDSYFLTGKPQYIEPRNYYEKYKTYLSECGLKAHTFHALRHTFATRCIEKGFDPKALSEILGHADVRITLDRYVHPSLDYKRNCMEMLFTN